jgi:putative RNA 2'-phosphotransferase
MDQQRLVRVSKYLSKHLRHQPQRLGLSLEPGGWVDIADLLQACARHNFALSRNELDEVVRRSDKQRFSIDPTGTRIRANQGHSVEVDLQLPPATPPSILFHGTGQGSVPFIQQHGLKKMARHHVHLSPDVETAIRVGKRHGTPVVFAVDCEAMVRDGFTFFLADNGVWLVDAVPPQYLRPITSSPLLGAP